MNADQTPLKFGKYRGLTPEELIDEDPGYLVWAYETVGKHLCSHSLYVAAVDAKVEFDAEEYRSNHEIGDDIDELCF